MKEKTIITRPPQTFEEYLVGKFELQEGCVKEAVIPPPDECSPSVHVLYGAAEWHILPIIVVFAMFLIILQSSLFVLSHK